MIKPARNVGFKSSQSAQNKRNTQYKFEELDIARRNAAMNSSRETLLREEEEERKRLRCPISTESNQEQQLPSGQPSRPLTQDKSDLTLTNMSLETVSDDDPSDLVILKDIKLLTRINLENTQDNTVQDPLRFRTKNLSNLRYHQLSNSIVR